MYLLNAFSLNMIPEFPCNIQVQKISLEEAQSALIHVRESDSAVGHPDTARVFSSQLGRRIEPQRINVSLERGNEALVGQYRGPRLAEGATQLPEGATIQWLLVTLL